MKGKSNASRKARASEGARIHGQVLCVSVIVSKRERESNASKGRMKVKGQE